MSPLICTCNASCDCNGERWFEYTWTVDKDEEKRGRNLREQEEGREDSIELGEKEIFKKILPTMREDKRREKKRVSDQILNLQK